MINEKSFFMVFIFQISVYKIYLLEILYIIFTEKVLPCNCRVSDYSRNPQKSTFHFCV